MKNGPFWTQYCKISAKIESKVKVRIEGKIENNVVPLREFTKTVIES